MAARKTNLRDHRDPVRSLAEAFPEFREVLEMCATVLEYGCSGETRAKVLARARRVLARMEGR